MAISVVQTATGTGNPPFSFGSAVTTGNTVILIAPGYSSTGSAPSTGSVKLGGNTITGTVAFFNPGSNSGVNSTSGSGNVAYVSIWMLPNVQVSGQTAVDVTFTAGNSGIGGVAYEVAGLGTSPSLDQSASGSSQSSSSLTTGATGAITGAPEFIVGGSMTFGGAGTPSGFTSVNPTTDTRAGYQIATSSGGTYTWSQSGAGTPWAAALATILGTPAAPPAVYTLISAPYRPPPPIGSPGTLVPAQVITGPLPPPPAELASVVAPSAMPYLAPWQIAPQVIGAPPGVNHIEILTASLAVTGSLARQAGKSLAATAVLTGTLQRGIGRGLAAAMAAAAALVRSIGRALASSGVVTGTLGRQAGKNLPGSAVLTGSGAFLKVRLLALAATLGLGGALTRQAGKTLPGTVPLSPALTRGVSRTLSAPVSLAGTIGRGIGRVLRAAASLAGGGSFGRGGTNYPITLAAGVAVNAAWSGVVNLLTVLFSVVTARQRWAVTQARQLWSVIRARNSN